MTGILLVIALFAPTTQPSSQASSQPHAKKHAGNANMGTQALVHRGGAFTIKDQVTLDAVAAKPADFAGKTVKVSGQISSVCQKSGCWLTIKGTGPAAVARVVFKDYAFFSPKDAKGKLATIEGVIEVKHMSEAERKHMAEDAKKPVDQVPADELRIIATALEVRAVGH